MIYENEMYPSIYSKTLKKLVASITNDLNVINISDILEKTANKIMTTKKKYRKNNKKLFKS